MDGDYAQYLLHAKAIIQGRSYSDTGYIFHSDAWSVGPRAYPPGLPLTLAPIVAVAGIHSPLFRLLMLGSTLAFAYLAWHRLAACVAPWQAAVGAGFAAFAIEAHWGLLDPISDPGFAALAWGMVLAVDDKTTPWNWRRILTVTMLGGGVLSYRMVGVAFIAAFGLWAFATWPKHRGRAAIPLVLWTLGGAAFVLTGLQVSDLLSLLAGWRTLTPNFEMVFREYGPSLVVAMLRPTSYLFINRAYYVIGALVSLVGLAFMTARLYKSFLAVGSILYVMTLLIAPVGEERYMWPLYPVAACALAVGLTQVLEFVRRYWPSLPAKGVAVAFLAMVATTALGTELTRARPEAIVGTPDGEALLTWLRDTHRTTPIRVVFFNPRVVMLETGVPSMGNVNRSPPGQMQALAEQGITHLIAKLEAVIDGPQQIASSLPRRYPDRFALVYQNSGFQVYQVLPGELPRRRGPRSPS